MRLSAVVIAAVLLAWWSSWLTTTPARADGLQNLAASWSLATQGTFSTDGDGRPDMFREPLTPVLGAAAIGIVTLKDGPAPLADWAAGDRVRALKHQNLLWMLLLCGAVWGSARALGGSRIAAGAAVVLVNGATFALRREFVDTLGSDLAAAALLTAACGLLATGWKTGRRRWFVAAGLAFGLAILVKASLLYVVIGLAGALALLAAWRNRGWPGDERGAAILLLLLTAALVTTPWSDRNHRLFGTHAITERGGEVLLLRAYENQVTPTEYAGVWCAFAPGRLQPLVCRLTGWSKADLREGGALGRFSRAAPQDPKAVEAAARAGYYPQPRLSFYHTAKARYRWLIETRYGRPAPTAD